MSSFFGSASGGTAGFASQFQKDDKRLMCSIHQQEFHLSPMHVNNGESFRTPWWPRSAIDASGGEMIDVLPQTWELPMMYSGAVAKLVFVGVSRDANGSILPSSTMKLFKTADNGYPDSKDRILDTVVSDATSGAFTLTTPYVEAHYITLVKDGSPSVQGISVNTLLGA